jgi:molybdopterin molybdotransferase
MEHLSVSEAQRVVLESVIRLGAEQVALEQSPGRVLAEEVWSNRDQPPYDISAMDGYALRSADLASVPATLEIVEDIKAGDIPFKTVAAGQCARIMTGAPIPQGANAVIRAEDTNALADGRVQINQAVKAGNDIRRLGENMRNGEVVLNPGTEITPGVVGVLAMVKRAQVRVYRQPRVAILSTGNELEGLDEPVDPNKIPDANSYALMAQTRALGIDPVLLGIARDDPDELARSLRRGLEYDMLVVSGGTSVGAHDYVRSTIESLGAQMLFWRVAMKPGHPVAFGKVGEKVIFGLPGNPVSSMVCFEHFVAPALRGMMGHARICRRTIEARLTHNIKHQPGRTEFIRVTLATENGGYAATSTGPQSSGMLLSMAKADGLAVLPAECNGLAEDSRVTVLLLDGTVFQEVIGFKD